MFARNVRLAAAAAALFVLAGAALPAREGKPPLAKDSAKKGTALSAEEAKWLKEMLDAEKDPAKRKEIEEEFKEESSLGRAAIYKLFTKDRGKYPPWSGKHTGERRKAIPGFVPGDGPRLAAAHPAA